MTTIGIDIANGYQSPERITSVGFGSFLGMDAQRDTLASIGKLNPTAKLLCRFFGRNILLNIVPTVDKLTELYADPSLKGTELIPGNEFNNPAEGATRTPAMTASAIVTMLGLLDKALPGVTLHLPAFAPTPGYLDYYLALVPYAALFDVVDIHCYGTANEMLTVVRDVATLFPLKPLCVTEYNFGAGKTVNLTDYQKEIREFLLRLPTQVRSAHWFMWRWDNPDILLPSSVNVENTTLEAFFTSLCHPQTDPPPPPKPPGASVDIQLSTPVTSLWTPNFSPGPRQVTRGLFIHDTTGPVNQQKDYDITVAYFDTPGTPASAHLVIGPGSTTRMVHDNDLAWHAIENNATHLGVELADDDNHTLPYTDYQYQTLAEYAVKAAKLYHFPLVRVFSQFEAGLIGHEDSEQGKRYGKTDPGPHFNWAKFLALCQKLAGSPDPTVVDAHHPFEIGDGFAAFLNSHPEYGLPRHNNFYDGFGNASLWTTGTPKFPAGSLLVWRKYLNRVEALTW